MRVVFMGTPEFAVPSLERLITDGHELVGVFTQPDKPKGRGYQLAAPPVKELALKHDIPVYQPVKMRDGTVLAILKELKPEIIVVVAYGRILPKDILEYPKYGCINVHGSILPKYRGAAPIQWSVLNGDEISGVTTMYMAEGLDTGDMLLSAETSIGENETSSELHDRLMYIGADCLSDTLKRIEMGNIERVPQDDSKSSYAKMLDKTLSKIDFTKTTDEVHNLIRGMYSWPVAYTYLEGKLLKIHKATKAVDYKGEAGEIVIDGERLIVLTADSGIELLEIQLEGAKRLPAKEFLRGKKINTNEKLI